MVPSAIIRRVKGLTRQEKFNLPAKVPNRSIRHYIILRKVIADKLRFEMQRNRNWKMSFIAEYAESEALRTAIPAEWLELSGTELLAKLRPMKRKME